MDAQHLDLLYLIVAAAVATYVTRFGGYVLITQLKNIPPRIESALNAVPAAVLTTLVAPAFVYGGMDVAAAMLVAFVIGLRFSTLRMLLVGWITVMMIRHLIM
ncbi:AzlD family protein [Sinorhizobium medicae]|uniref:Branched-chain amino acid transport n=2 Tax=Sinorhizobium medicae TaxID=110321 RepID=A0A508WUM7_9HYPH|nr:AzlD family protein [Sinorhizobium medicae]ABR60890.1 branched-chain amino acid transport [Sinorhizobium medicae WSM419]MBO1943793.1 AzlD family protein [Sinorhizobium medicae]MBO1964871.1 AzlD family protein [Sinorhizobium medicae]MDX0407048.1 AzlD family protein [Sinorhizobium medicae]MDX0412526.1 AzlD family protein [Sinorhizobium medicae]